MSDGLGSGAWTTNPVTFTNLVEVTSVSDFPDPIGGVITPDANTGYYISGVVDISPNVLSITNPGCALLGFNRATDVLVSSTASPLISSINQNLVMQGFSMANPTGTLLNLGNSGTNVVLVDKIIFGDCVSIGTIGDFQNVIFDNCGINATSLMGGVTFTGSNHTEIIVRDSFFSNWMGTLFNLGSSVSTFVSFTGTRFLSTDPSYVAIDGLPNAGNVSQLGTITNCSFFGMTNPTGTNIDHADSGWFNQTVVGIQESDFIGFLSMHNNATDTIITVTNQWEKVAGTTVASTSNERFSMSANNELTADILLDRPIQINVNAIALKSGGGTDVVEFTVFKEPSGGGGFTIVDANTISSIAATTNIGSTSLTLLDTASPGDKYSVYARNTSSTSDLEIKDLQFSIKG